MSFADKVLRDGYAIIPRLIDRESVKTLVAEAESIQTLAASERGGVRNLLSFRSMRSLAESETLLQVVEPILGSKVHVVRGILFDKTPDANWRVPFHQDVTIAVKERRDVRGFGPWSMKEGVLCVQPPADVLEHMVSVRIHIDDCPASNGALRVVTASHCGGKVPAAEVERLAAKSQQEVCEVPSGGALVMRPLLFHASSSSAHPGHRRVLHFDYASCDLPGGLRWHEEVVD